MMQGKRTRSFVGAMLFMIAMVVVNGAWAGASAKLPLKIAVSIPPMQEWVERIAGDRAQVTVIMPPGSSPHNFEPSPRQIAQLGSAQVWFAINVDFEYSLKPKVRGMFPSLAIVDVTKNVKFRALKPSEQEPEELSAENIDPALVNRDQHTWLGIDQAKTEIAVIRDTLISLDPSGEAFYKANYQAYAKEIDATYAQLKAMLAPLSGSKVFVYHPAFGYFLDMFGIEQVAVELGGKEPTQKELVALIELAKKEKARAIFTQVQFSQSAAKAIANSIGATVVPIDPLAADWRENLLRMGRAIAESTPN